MRQIIALVSVLFITAVLPLGCCWKGPHYWDFESLDILLWTDGDVIVSDTIHSDTLSIQMIANMELISDASSIELGNTGALYGFQPCDNQSLNISYKSILITSDNDYNNIPAGESINHFFFLTGDRHALNFPIDTLPQLYLQKGTSNEYFWLPYLTTATKPAQPDHTFTVTLTAIGGRQVMGVSPSIVWQ